MEGGQPGRVFALLLQLPHYIHGDPGAISESFLSEVPGAAKSGEAFPDVLCVLYHHTHQVTPGNSQERHGAPARFFGGSAQMPADHRVGHVEPCGTLGTPVRSLAVAACRRGRGVVSSASGEPARSAPAP